MILPDTKHYDALLLTGLFVEIIFSLCAHEVLDLSSKHFTKPFDSLIYKAVYVA